MLKFSFVTEDRLNQHHERFSSSVHSFINLGYFVMPSERATVATDHADDTDGAGSPPRQAACGGGARAKDKGKAKVISKAKARLHDLMALHDVRYPVLVKSMVACGNTVRACC